MAKEYDKVRPEDETEKAIFDKAFSASRAKKSTERMSEAQKALYDYRSGLNKAVDSSLKTKIANRKKKIDEAGGY